MRKYYEVELNCGRVRNRYPFTNHYGFIEIWPVKGTTYKQGLFGMKPVPTIDYAGWQNVIAELKDDHFEDLILGKAIQYDPNGLRDITTATNDELKEELYTKGLTCYYFKEIEEEKALYYIEKIKKDEKIMEKYIQELEEIENKNNLIKELNSREDAKTYSASKEHVKKQRKRIVKSA